MDAIRQVMLKHQRRPIMSQRMPLSVIATVSVVKYRAQRQLERTR